MKSLRIKDGHEEKIRQTAISFNKKLVAMNKSPIRDSELVHSIIDIALNRVEIDENGKIGIK